MARILVIDDEDALRAMLKKALEKQGHEVLEATSGAEGVRVYQERTVDLVMTDMFMPGPCGIDAIAALNRETWRRRWQGTSARQARRR